MRDHVQILTLRFPMLTRGQALAQAHRLAAAGRSACIFTPNAEIACHAAKSPAFSDILNGADMLLPDGVGISLAARRQGVDLARIAGIDFAQALLATAPARGYRVFLLGARPGVAVAAGKALVRRFPRVTICGAQDGYYPTEMEHALAAAIRAARPHLLFVCLGSPRQEEWIATHRPPCLSLGLGGALDVWAGERRRAPAAVQGMGLEWLWRTVSDPVRLMRLPALASFSLRVLTTPRAERAENCKKRV